MADSDLVDTLLRLALLGSVWVLYLLLGLGVLSLAIVIERWWFFHTHRRDLRAVHRRDAERFLVFLGTLGNNAPFLGLLGTVLGIIRAFHELARHGEGGVNVVMAGISEALVATAVGLVVALPAVIAFNHFSRRADDVAAAGQA